MKVFLPIVLAAGLSVSAAAAPIFRNPLPFPFSGVGSSLIRADFDGNGHPDVLHGAGSNLVVHLSNGTGPFAPPVITPANWSGYPRTGDFNGDGKSDLVFSSGSQQVTVMLGNGDGTFLSGSSFSTVHTPQIALAGRFNGDQHIDLAVGMAQELSPNYYVSIHFGDGTGHFSSGQVTTIAERLTNHPPVDLNGDNYMDLIGRSKVHLGNGNGGFTGITHNEDLIDNVVAVDLNHDGKRDLAHTGGTFDNGVVLVRLGNGDGTFQSRVAYPAGDTYGYPSIDAADVSGDGHIDILVTAGSGITVGLLLGKGDGTFHPVQHQLVGWGGAVTAGDFDRDGKVDFVTGFDKELNALSFVRGNGNGTFQTYRVFIPGAFVTGGVPADMNGDGKQDVVVQQYRDGDGSKPRDLAVLINDGTGKLAAPILTSIGTTNAGVVEIGDLNNDGRIDAVTITDINSPKVRTFLGNGNGTFAAPVVSGISVSGLRKLGHFNGDNLLDLFAGSGTVFPGLGNGTFGAGTSSGYFGNAVFGDLNGDGTLDIVSKGSSNSSYVSVGINDGSGHFAVQVITTEDIEPKALADFNGDLKTDLLSTHYTGTQVRLGNGNGTFGPPLKMVMNPAPSFSTSEPAAVADFDGDGQLDASIGTSVFLGNGDGTFRERARYRTTGGLTAYAADMDGSGSPDLVMTSGAVFVLLTRTASDPTATSSITLSSNKSVAEYAENVTLTATVTGGATALSGTVTFLLDDVPAAIIEVENGQAVFQSIFPVGGHNVTAVFHDENYLPSTASTGLTITKAKTTVTITGTPNPRPYGQTVYITTSLIAPRPVGAPAPGGTMTLRDGDTPLPVTLVDNRATINTLSIGSHVISVDYPGDTNYEPSTASYTQVITKPQPIMDMETTPAIVMANSPATFTVDFPWSANVTGSVTFSVNGTPQSVVPLQNGVAVFQTSFAWGFHAVTAHYAGDDTWGEADNTNHVNVHIGPWGTPIMVDAVGHDTFVIVKFSRVAGAVEYTLWRKMSLAEPWQVSLIASPDPYWETDFIYTIGALKSALFAVTARDSSGNVSPMSAPALATTLWFGDDLQPNVTKVQALHLTHLRTAINLVRTFAGLAAYSYANTIAAGQPIRATDVQEMRTALGQARSAIGLPAIPFTDPTLTPLTSKIRAAHVMELRAGVN